MSDKLKVNVTTRITDDEYQQWKSQAASQGRSLSNWIRQMVNDGLSLSIQPNPPPARTAARRDN